MMRITDWNAESIIISYSFVHEIWLNVDIRAIYTALQTSRHPKNLRLFGAPFTLPATTHKHLGFLARKAHAPEKYPKLGVVIFLKWSRMQAKLALPVTMVHREMSRFFITWRGWLFRTEGLRAWLWNVYRYPRPSCIVWSHIAHYQPVKFRRSFVKLKSRLGFSTGFSRM